jgi:uncharacterized protein
MTCIKPQRLNFIRRDRFAALLTAVCARICATLFGALLASAHAQQGPQPKLPTARITAGIHVIEAELAITPAQQQTGMMFRTAMGTNEGMLFIGEELEERCFWMRNTLIPLSIAFVADDGTIVNIADMQPRSEVTHCSAKPVRFALEMNRGWFNKRGIKPGTRLRGKPFKE